MSLLERARALTRPVGGESRILDLGAWRVRLEGLPADLAGLLDTRWGGYVVADLGGVDVVRVQVVEGESGLFLDRWRRGDRYRAETAIEDGVPVVRSFNFAAWPVAGEGEGWRAAIRLEGGEMPGRVTENVVRCLAARRTVAAGGLPLHAAGVLRDGGAWVFSGPSGAGKSTVVGLSEPSPCLGDDLAIVLPRSDHWVVASTPFDNRERAPVDPPRGTFPLRGVWRLVQATEHRLEPLGGLVGESALLGCVTMTPLFPDLGGALLDNARSLCAAVPFARLHFRKDPEFWSLLSDAVA